MKDALVIILGIIGTLAIYWVLRGQWKYNKQMQEGANQSEIDGTQRKNPEGSHKDQEKKVEQDEQRKNPEGS